MASSAEVFRYPDGQAGAAKRPAEPPGPVDEASRFKPHHDPFLGCLQFLARHFERPTSATMLSAGLPLEDGRLTRLLFTRAARRIGLAVEPAQRRLETFTAIDCPAVILLRDGRPLVLLTPMGEESCDVLMPETQGVIRAANTALLQLYSGEALLVGRSFDRAGTDANRPSSLTQGHWFWEPVKRCWRDLSTVALAALIVNLIGLTAPLFTMNIYDRVLPNKAFSTLWVLAVGFMVVLVFDFVMKVARATLLDRIGKTLDIELSEALFEKVLNTPLGSRPSSTGEFVNRVAQYEFVRDFFTAGTLTLFIDCAFLFVFLFVIALVAGWVVAVPLVAMLLVVTAGLLAQRLIGERMAAAQAEGSLRHAMLVEAVGAIETIKSIRAEGVLLRRWDTLIRAASVTQDRIKSVSSTTISFTLLVQQMVTVWVVVLGTYRFAAGEMTTGAIIATVMLSSRAVSPLSALASMLTRARHAFAAMKTLDQVMALPDERVSSRAFVDRSVQGGDVQFRSGAFSYPGSDRRVLSGISLRVKAGEKVGIIGRVGSGKTTLGRLVAGLYPLSEGELLIDGVDVRQYHPHEVRKAVAIVAQDTDLFIGSLRDNIAMADPAASDAALLEACRLAGVDDFAAQHPMGYDLPVGERGRNLSTGQRQAVALARAFLVRPKILFLDEPSSAMDLASERSFLTRLIATMPADQTLLIATHRYSMLELVDRLLVIDNGRIIADGRKDAVMNALKAANGPS
jgi:ATP-binding cassette subfamily C protein LapB